MLNINDPNLLRILHAYQKNKTGGLLNLLRIIALAFCILATGLGLLWFFKSSWLALIFAIIFGLAGLALIGISLFIADKLNTLNTLTAGAVDFYEKSRQNKTTE